MLTTAETNGDLQTFGCSGLDDLYAALGYGKLGARQVVAKLSPESLLEKPAKDAGAALNPPSGTA